MISLLRGASQLEFTSLTQSAVRCCAMFKSLKAIASPLLLVLDPLVSRSRNRNVAMISAEVFNGLMLGYVTIKYGLLKYRIRSLCLITSPTSQFIDMRAMPRTMSRELSLGRTCRMINSPDPANIASCYCPPTPWPTAAAPRPYLVRGVGTGSAYPKRIVAP